VFKELAPCWEPILENKLSTWRQWVQYPQRLWLYNAIFQIHFWIGAMAGAYLAFMSVTGSVIVFRNELPPWAWIESIVKLHTNLMAGSAGRVVNGIAAICLTLLCLTGAFIWWPGLKNWRRSLTVVWGSNFPRIQWDLHSALGFWCFLFVLTWGVSGIYFSFPDLFALLYLLDPADKVTDRALLWLSEAHFGRYGRLSEAVWVVLGLTPAALAFTGTFVCCRRVIFKKPSNPHR
jgi:uncharacterized iron-regulated membrane protein